MPSVRPCPDVEPEAPYDLNARYFAGRADGLHAGRLVQIRRACV